MSWWRVQLILCAAQGVLSFPLLAAPISRVGSVRICPAFVACRLHGAERFCHHVVLRAANAEPDAGLSKEQKLKKYQQLAVELITKAQKLPPGSASKTRYLMQARNAKAVADAMGYSAEPANPKQAAFDAARAYQSDKTEREKEPADAAAPVPRKRGKVSFDIVSAQPEMAEKLCDVVNWAYRGKSGEQVCCLAMCCLLGL